MFIMFSINMYAYLKKKKKRKQDKKEGARKL